MIWINRNNVARQKPRSSTTPTAAEGSLRSSGAPTGVPLAIRNGGAWSTVGTLANNAANNPEIVLANATGDAIKVIVQSAQSGSAVFIAEASLAYDGGAQTTAVQRFDAWGNKTQSAGAAIPLYGYTGREPDATGLIYYRARYYDPTIGRFISRDPAGMPDGVNRYAYVGNDPVNATDPSGLLFSFVHNTMLRSPIPHRDAARISSFANGVAWLERRWRQRLL